MTDTEDGAPAVDAPPILDGDGRLLDPLVRRWTAIGVALAVAGFWLLGTLGRVTNLFADPHTVTARFFDIQADALMHGRLSVPRGSLYIEEFVTPHGSYMYFGVFPALLRVPIRLVFSGLDNRLTLFSCLLAMAVIAVSTARLARHARSANSGSPAEASTPRRTGGSRSSPPLRCCSRPCCSSRRGRWCTTRPSPGEPQVPCGGSMRPCNGGTAGARRTSS